MIKTKVLREKDEKALQQELLELTRQRFNLRMQRNEDHAVKPHEFRFIRLGIARIKTVLNEKRKSNDK